MALAAPVLQAVAQADSVTMGQGVPGLAPLGGAIPTQPEAAPPQPSKAHCLWAVLIARIDEVFPLLCPLCGGQMRRIAFITEGTGIRQYSGAHRCRHRAAANLPRHAGRRCGRTVMRRLARMCQSRGIG